MTAAVPQGELTLTSILRHAESVHADRPIYSLTADGSLQSSRYGELAARARRLANGLTRLGLARGDCVSTFAWNDLRHLEAYFALPCLGLICHTVNPRLHGDQIRYILRDANSRWLLVDPQFVPHLLPLLADLPALNGVIVLAAAADLDSQWPAALPQLQWLDYESLVAGESDQFHWPALDEQTPSGCCYTSGTTGNPKGVLYSHRSTLLHSLALSLPDAGSLSADDCALVIVPMFHVNGWGLPYACALTGAALALPGRFMGDGEKLAWLMAQAGVTLAAGVPTVWQSWANYMVQQGSTLTRPLRAVIGGSACTRALRDALEQLGCQVRLAWGMTETSPVGTVNSGTEKSHALSPGQPVFGVELRIVDDAGRELPRDGAASGELQVRGPWIARGYIGKPGAPEFSPDGWFSTGDVARLSPDGYLTIADRAKDVIKSGGEWISSLILEEVASSHPSVAAAAVVAMPHPQWDERPLLLVVPRESATIDGDELLHWYDGKVARWWRPDAVQVISNLPLTATGKVDKKLLREQYARESAQP